MALLLGHRALSWGRVVGVVVRACTALRARALLFYIFIVSVHMIYVIQFTARSMVLV
jgi:hypothetical protein